MNHTPRQRASSGSPYEARIGISRGVRAGPLIAIAGTAPIGADGKTVAPGDPAAQARRCFEIVRAALEQLGARLADVTRTRILLISTLMRSAARRGNRAQRRALQHKI